LTQGIIILYKDGKASFPVEALVFVTASGTLFSHLNQ
jgi:hypothetical protein